MIMILADTKKKTMMVDVDGLCVMVYVIVCVMVCGEGSRMVLVTDRQTDRKTSDNQL